MAYREEHPEAAIKLLPRGSVDIERISIVRHLSLQVASALDAESCARSFAWTRVLGIGQFICVVEGGELFVVVVFLSYGAVCSSCNVVYGGGPKLVNEAGISLDDVM